MAIQKAQPKRKSPSVGVTYDKRTKSTTYHDLNSRSWDGMDISKARARVIVGDKALAAGKAGAKADTSNTSMASSMRSVSHKTRAKPKAK